MTELQMSATGWRLLTGELAQRKRAIAWLAGWSTVECLPALASGALIAAALDRGFIPGHPLIGIGWLGLLGLAMMIGAAATRETFRWLADIVEPLRDVLVRSVVGGALDRAMHGDDGGDGASVSRLSGQAEMVRNLVAALLRTLRPTMVSLILALIGLLALAPVVAAVVAPLVLLSLALFAWSMRALAARWRVMVLAEEAMAGVSAEVFGAIRDVVACGALDTAHDTIGQAVTAEAHASLAAARTSSSRSIIMALGGHIPIVLVLALAPWLLRSGRLTAGELVGAITYLVGTLDPALRSTAGAVGSFGGQLSVLLRRIGETSASGPLTRPPSLAEPGSGHVRLTNLTFAYGPNALPVINDLTLDIRSGEHLAVVGPSGIGKSTLASLIAGLNAPQAGTVLLGGVSMAEIAETDLRHAVALVPQEAYVFTGSLRENLDYLHPEATTTDLDAAVDALGIRPLVNRLGGYQAQLGVGGPVLSAGERQLIVLARVYLCAAKVIVLDEATCHVDPVAEAIAEEALAATGRTLVVIAHRISSARRAERILLLDGTLATVGSHSELLVNSTRYAALAGHWGPQAGVQDQAV